MHVIHMPMQRGDIQLSRPLRLDAVVALVGLVAEHRSQSDELRPGDTADSCRGIVEAREPLHLDEGKVRQARDHRAF